MVKYFVLFLAAACCVGARNVCPEGWIDLTYLDMGCVLLQNATSQLMNNEEAYNYCYDQDARLLEVHDEDQKDQLELVLHHEEESNSFWLGATDLYHEGAWIWGNSMIPVEEFIWEEGEPNNGPQVNCMLWSSEVDAAKDHFCSGVSYPLCQIPIF